jgi:hypothetical protein
VKAFAVVILLALAAFLGYGWGRSPSGDDGPPVMLEVERAAYEARLESLRIDRDGWRARLEGVRTVSPDTVVRTDTLVMPPDTVIRFVSVDSRGRLGVELLTTVSDSTQLRAPELHTGFDISRCDEGWTVEAGVVTCNPARLGHLWLGVEASRHPSLLAWWTPSYRSPWQVSVSYDGSRFDFGIRRGLRLF